MPLFVLIYIYMYMKLLRTRAMNTTGKFHTFSSYCVWQRTSWARPLSCESPLTEQQPQTATATNRETNTQDKLFQIWPQFHAMHKHDPSCKYSFVHTNFAVQSWLLLQQNAGKIMQFSSVKLWMLCASLWVGS